MDPGSSQEITTKTRERRERRETVLHLMASHPYYPSVPDNTTLLSPSLAVVTAMEQVCVCVCVREREREREHLSPG